MADDARISTALPRHPKTIKLKRRLGAGGCWSLVCLFVWVADNRSDGKLDGMSDEDIEIAADWAGESGAFVKILAEVGFLDGAERVYRIHDWAEHNPWAANRGKRVEAAKSAAAQRWARGTQDQRTTHECDNDAGQMPSVCDPHPQRIRVAMPTTQPNPTRQHHTKNSTGAVAPADWIPIDAWAGFIEMRRRIRSPLTERAVRLIVSSLEKLRAEGCDVGAVLDQSTQNDWKGVYPLKGRQWPNETHAELNRHTIQTRSALEQFKQAEARQDSRMGDSDDRGDGGNSVVCDRPAPVC